MSQNITNIILQGTTHTLVNDDWFYAFRDSDNQNKIYAFDPFSNNTNLIEITEIVEPCFIQTISNITYEVSLNDYPSYTFGLGPNNSSPGINGTTGASEVVYSNYTTNNNNALITDLIGLLLPAQTLLEAKNMPYRFRVFIDDTNQYIDWIIEQYGIILCIHKDMIVDDANKKISELCTYPEDPEFITLLNMGKSRRFVKFPVGSLGTNSPSSELLLTPEHPILFNGSEIISKKLVGYNGIHIIELQNMVNIYAIAHTIRKSTKIHNVDVMQWCYTDFVEYCAKHNYNYDKNYGLLYKY